DQLTPYSLASYQQALSTLYRKLTLQPAAPGSPLSPARILSAPLTPDRFHFLLTALKPAPVLPKACRAVIFDIYGTLLIAPPGGAQPDPFADPVLRDILRSFHHTPPTSPSSELHAAVLRHHAAAGVEFPEIDLRVLWREILHLPSGTDTTALVEALEAAWHPARPMPGAEQVIGTLARSGLSLGLLSNAQSNTLTALGGISDLFAPELTILSYQHGIAKPSPALYQILTDRLAGRGISPAETLFVGNDPLHDILPAAAAGFQTALFTGHPDSRRPGECFPDLVFTKWPELIPYIRQAQAP
ncbi:MAG: HAD family hydrolase, partial [Luteolibacter sp.]